MQHKAQIDDQIDDSTRDAIVELRRLGHTPLRIVQAPYESIRSGDVVAPMHLYKGRWLISDIVNVCAFSNYAHDFLSVLAWLSTGSGVGCPLVVLSENEHGSYPRTDKHMPSPGYGYEFGVAHRGYWHRCHDQSCVCYQGVAAGYRSQLCPA